MLSKLSRLIALSLLLSIISITFMGLAVYATTYTSTISISSNSTLTGTARSYVGSTHRIDNLLTSRNWEVTGNNYATFVLQQKNGLQYVDRGDATLNLRTVGQTYSATYKNQSNGTFRYFIYNAYGIGDYRRGSVDGWSSDQVTMSSF